MAAAAADDDADVRSADPGPLDMPLTLQGVDASARWMLLQGAARAPVLRIDAGGRLVVAPGKTHLHMLQPFLDVKGQTGFSP